MKVIIDPHSERENNKWIAAGIIRFPDGATFTERTERYFEVKFDTKEEADAYFLKTSYGRYQVN